MTLIDDFKTRFPEFDATVVDQFFPALEPVYPCYYGGNIDNKCDKEIIMQLLAHLFVLDQKNSNGKGSTNKNLQSKSVGSVSLSYSQSSESNTTHDFFRSTSYGQRYLFLTSHNVGGYVV